MEQGSAEIKIKLKNGIIKVMHSEGNFTLAEWISSKGDWNRLWSVINKMVKANNGKRKGGLV